MNVKDIWAPLCLRKYFTTVWKCRNLQGFVWKHIQVWLCGKSCFSYTKIIFGGCCNRYFWHIRLKISLRKQLKFHINTESTFLNLPDMFQGYIRRPQCCITGSPSVIWVCIGNETKFQRDLSTFTSSVWCKSTQIALRLHENQDNNTGNNIYTLLITFIAFSSYISFKFHFPYKLFISLTNS